MLLEQSLVNPNFIGKDSFRWFVGQVTKFKNTDNGYKVKVRIIGYHPDAASLVRDEDLPWAHVLVPLNMGAGEGGTGVSFNPRGSETVIGFFADGEDGQQPVVIGALFSGANIVHPNSWDKGTNGFNPFRSQPASQANQSNIVAETGKPPGDSGTIPNADGTITDKDGKNKETQRQKTAASNENQVVTIVPSCKSSNDIFSKIAQALRKFVKLLNTVTNITDTYINPVLNYIQDIPTLISDIAVAVSDGISEYIKITRDTIIAEIYDKLKGIIEGFLPKDLILIKKIGTDKIVDGIWCLFQKILKKLFKFVFNFLFEMVGKVVSIPLCAAESFIGSIMQALANEIEEAIGPALKEVTSILGGGIGTITSYIAKAIGYARLALSFLTCENAECEAVFDYEMNKGYVPKGDANFQKILDYRPAQGVRNLFNDGANQAKGWLGSVGIGEGVTTASTGELIPGLGFGLNNALGFGGGCDASVLDCGFPKVTIFGGGGSGASGSAIVDVFGQILGVNISDPGSGYTSDPYVSIDDDCENGVGARAYTSLTPFGSLNNVIITYPGSGYIGPTGTGTGTGGTGTGTGGTGTGGTGTGGTGTGTGTGGTGTGTGTGGTGTGTGTGGTGTGTGTGGTGTGTGTGGTGTGTQDPCDVNPIDENGNEVVGFIKDVIILNTGISYKSTDKIVNATCNTDVEIYPKVDPDGRIIGVNIVNPGTAIRVYPELVINTEDGFGASLLPILGFNPVDKTVSSETDRQKVERVILCAEEHE
jgi:hypothetical protein